MIRRKALPAAVCAAFLLCWPTSIFPWGGRQHEVVAEIAEQNLTPETRQGIVFLCGPFLHLRDVANWADAIKHARSDTGPWHYINYPLSLDEPDYDVMNTEDGNVVWAVAAQIDILKSPAAGREARAEALKFLVHFVADLHQPLHCGMAEDAGGNYVAVWWQGKMTNLHRIWDSAVLPQEAPDIRRWAADLQSRITANERSAIMRGKPYDWMVESHRIAREFCYARLQYRYDYSRKGRVRYYPQTDIQEARAVARRRLTEAGLRLAMVLNGIFAERQPEVKQLSSPPAAR